MGNCFVCMTSRSRDYLRNDYNYDYHACNKTFGSKRQFQDHI